jgi:hypothetical protein
VETSNITERGRGGPDVPPPNVQPAGAEVRLAGGDALQWGLASLLYSSLLLLLVPLGLLVLLVVPMFAEINPTWDTGGRIVSTLLIPLGTLLFDVLAMVSLVFGLAGLRVARARKQPAVLQSAGLLLGLGAVLGWVMNSVAAVMVLNSIWHIKTWCGGRLTTAAVPGPRGPGRGSCCCPP